MEAAASLTALIALSLQSTKFVYQTIDSIRKGPSIIRKLVESSKDLEAILQQLLQLIQYSTHAEGAQAASIWKPLEQKISQCSRDMQEVSNEINTLDLSGSKYHVDRAWTRIKIPLKEKFLERLRNQVQQHSTELGLQLNIINSHLDISRDALQKSRHGASQAALHDVTTELSVQSIEIKDSFSERAQVIESYLTKLVTDVDTAERESVEQSRQTRDSLQYVTSTILSRLEENKQCSQQDAHENTDQIGNKIEKAQESSAAQSEVIIELLRQIQGSMKTTLIDSDSTGSHSNARGSNSEEGVDSKARDAFLAAIDRLCLLASRTNKLYHSAEAENIIDDLELVLNTILVRDTKNSIPTSERQKRKCLHDDQPHGTLRAIKKFCGILTASRAIEISEADTHRIDDLQQRRKKLRRSTEVYEMADCTAVVSIKSYAHVERMHYPSNMMTPMQSLDVLQGNISILPSNSINRAKISASFIQQFTSSGFNSLNPTLSFRPMIPHDADIFVAVTNGNVQRMLELFTKGEASLRDCDFQGRSLLNYAISGQQLTSVRFLVDHGADVDSIEKKRYYDGKDFEFYGHPLNQDSFNDFEADQHELSTTLAIRQCLLESGADPLSQLPDQSSGYVFHSMLAGSPADVLAMTFKCGKEYLDLEERDEHGRTYLLRSLDTFLPYQSSHDRVGNDIIRSLQILFTHGADVAAKDMYGRGCLHTWLDWERYDWNGREFTCLNGYSGSELRRLFVDVLCLLVEKGADIYAVSTGGFSVTEYAHFYRRGKYWEEALQKCGFDVEQVYLSDHNNGRLCSNDIYAPTRDRPRRRGTFDTDYFDGHGVGPGAYRPNVVSDSDSEHEESEDVSSTSDDCSEGEEEDLSSSLKGAPTDANEDLMDKADENSDTDEEMGGVSVADEGLLEQRGRSWML